MSEGRLAGLTVIAIHYPGALKLDTDKVVKCYIQAYHRHLFYNFVLFEDDWDE